MKGSSGIANSHRVLGPNHGGKLALEGLNLRSAGQEIRVQNGQDGTDVIVINGVSAIRNKIHGQERRPVESPSNCESRIDMATD